MHVYEPKKMFGSGNLACYFSLKPDFFIHDLVINISHSMDNMDKAVLNFEKDRDFCLFYIVD
jgi:hypothetical protein